MVDQKTGSQLCTGSEVNKRMCGGVYCIAKERCKKEKNVIVVNII